MKKLLILSYRSCARHLGMYLLILLQLLTVTIGTNVLLASYNQQTMLQEPYLELMQSDGYYLSGGFDEELVTQDGTPMMDVLEGDWNSYRFSERSDFVSCGQRTVDGKFLIYEDAFWDAYHPVLKHGRWKKSDSGTEPWCVATANVPGDSVTIPGYGQTVAVKGVLGDLCYLPSMSSWSRNGSIQDNFYDIFQLERESTVYFLISRSQWNKLGIPEDCQSHNQIITTASQLTDAQCEKNAALFRELGEPQIPLSVLLERAEDARLENVRKFLPLLVSMLIITMFGILCVTAIHTMQDLKQTAVYYLCGMRWRTSLTLTLLQLGILLVLTAGCTGAAWLIATAFGVCAQLGLRFDWNNLGITMLLFGLVLLSGCLMPYGITKRVTPTSLLRSART